MKRTLWFDLDGTILSVKDRFCKAHEFICSELGISSLSHDQYWDLRCKGTSTQQILQVLGCDHFFQRYIEIRNEILESSRFLSMDSMWPFSREVLDATAAKYRLFLLTGRVSENNLIVQLKNLDIYSYFEQIFVVSPFGDHHAKSDLLIAKGSQGDYCIGDTPKEIRAGKEAGMITVAFEGGMSTKERLTAETPDALIGSWEQFMPLLMRN